MLGIILLLDYNQVKQGNTELILISEGKFPFSVFTAFLLNTWMDKDRGYNMLLMRIIYQLQENSRASL